MFNRRVQRTSRWCLLGMWTVLLCGCLAADHEEAEHHTPAHKPPDFPAAVVRLNELHAEILSRSERSEQQIEVFTELDDIVRWLPGLAADSDLAEEPWNLVQRNAKELQLVVQAAKREQGESRQSAYQQSAPEIERELQQLADVAQHFPRPAHLTAEAAADFGLAPELPQQEQQP